MDEQALTRLEGRPKMMRRITFPMGNYHSLADSVCKILGDPEIKLRLEKKVGVLGKTFLWKEVAKKYVKLFEKVFKEKK